MSSYTFDTITFAFSVIRVMTPILYASMACMVFTKGGIDSIATEGIMLICALAGALGSYFFQNAFMGVLTAITVGIMMACIFGYVTLSLEANPVLTGIALNIFSGGITIFIIYYVTGEKGSTQSLAGKVVPSVALPFIENIPIIGQIISGHNLLTYLALIMIFMLRYFIYKTPQGLRIRTVGENVEAGKSVGISIMRYKYMTLFIAGALAGIGGAFMSSGYVSFFSKDMIAGRGFIGMAAESMGRGNPLGILAASVFFSVFDALGIQLQLMNFPHELMQLMPYLVTIIAIAVYSYLIEKRKGY